MVDDFEKLKRSAFNNCKHCSGLPNIEKAYCCDIQQCQLHSVRNIFMPDFDKKRDIPFAKEKPMFEVDESAPTTKKKTKK